MPDRNATLRRAVIALMALCLISDASVRAASTASGDIRPRSAGAAVNAATVLGNAWKADNSPLPHARLRLRNVTTGRLAATTVANASGQFSFDNAEPGSYVIELVDEREKVIALGQIFSLGPGETVATFVRLGARAPWFTGFFSNAATTAVTAASSLGVTALGSDGQPVSAAPASGQ
jgi:hypothetical protein